MTTELALQQVLKELEFRMAITKAMLSTLDFEYVLYVILSGITSRDGIGLNRAFLFLDDDEGRQLKVGLAVGPKSGEDAKRIWNEIERNGVNFPDLLPRYEAVRQNHSGQALTRELSSFALPLHRLQSLALTAFDLQNTKDVSLSAVLATCLVARQPFWNNDVTVRQEVGGASGEIAEFRNVAAVPLRVDDRPIGVIFGDNMYTGHPVSADDARRMEALGNLAALAIDRARLHARTVAMAEIDGLTGVYNRRHYSEALERAIAAAGRGGHELSIVVFDLDHFKRVNDRYGHLVGDELLKDIAKMLVSQVRSADLVARYGGEEFVVLLKNTNQAAAVQVAEKLRQQIKEAALAGGRISGVTLSAGVASTRGNETATQLFERADRALYDAKQGGRDRVAVAAEAADVADEAE